MRWCLPLFAALLAAPAAAADRPDPAAVAKRIDHHIAARLDAVSVKPAPVADDTTFVRRTYLVLVGRIPLPSEVHAFLDDADPKKREKLIDKLLDSPGYANHFTTVWRGWMLPEALTSFEVAAISPSFTAWLRKQLAANTRYDRVVTELLTVPVAPPRNRTAPQPGDADTLTPFGTTGGAVVFYYAKEAKPENLAAATARLFLGVQLDCAQCHDHPFAKWSRDQFWGLAGFFAGVEATQQGNFFGPLREVIDRRELAIPNTDRVVQATFLDDREPDWKPRTSGRVTLAEWVTAKDNPFFARATANRMWGYVFGTGVYEPVDDFTDENRPSHPEMLDELARAFADGGFDLKFLLKAILLSDAYQRDSALTEPGQTDPRLYARFPVQGLSPEQLYDSLALVASSGEGPDGGAYLQNPGAGKRQFVEKFALVGGKTESPSSIIQALTLMNGELTAAATAAGQSRAVGAAATLPGLTAAERVEVLYLTALGRRPKPAELERALKHVGTATADKAKDRYAGLLWALLNSVEFRTNH